MREEGLKDTPTISEQSPKRRWLGLHGLFLAVATLGSAQSFVLPKRHYLYIMPNIKTFWLVWAR